MPGTPQPKGSGSRVAAGVYLEAGTPASRKRKMAWYRHAMVCACLAAQRAGVRRIDVGLSVSVEFRMPIPASRRGGARKIEPGTPHVSKPDCDKLFRALGDSLTKSGLVADDSLIHTWQPVKLHCKVYAAQGAEGAWVILSW